VIWGVVENLLSLLLALAIAGALAAVVWLILQTALSGFENEVDDDP
jgi:hypothetical protein